MSNKLYKILLILGIFAVLVALLAFWLTFKASADLEVDFLDVGQGDAILIKAPYGQNILIDGGPDNTIIKRLLENLPWWDKKIDLIILTHPHNDHVTGLIDVIKRYNIKQILYTGIIHNDYNYLTWLDLIQDKKIPLIIIDRPQVIKLGENCELQIIYPRESLLGQVVDNLNNSSIVVKLIYGQTKFLLTSDIETEAEQELTNGSVDLRAQVLKVAHHGSDTSNSKEFLVAVKPEITVIQIGDNNLGHPSRRVLKRLERIRAKVLRNDFNGTVRIVSNGIDIDAKTDK